MALAILKEHTRLHHLTSFPEIAGAEWWIQYKGNASNASDRSAGVDLHYDKDEGLIGGG